MQISFDDLNRIRILEADHFKQTEQLAEECTNFVESLSPLPSPATDSQDVQTETDSRNG